jgi:hypothetical protein
MHIPFELEESERRLIDWLMSHRREDAPYRTLRERVNLMEDLVVKYYEYAQVLKSELDRSEIHREYLLNVWPDAPTGGGLA